jgi:YHS domain-containing protein
MQLTRRTTLALLMATVATPVFAAMPAQYTKSGLAIAGYDPVAYFTESAARKGSAQHSLSWNGATWRFASAKNKKLFEADPEKYAPQYGGYCAYAMANGDLVSINPKAWDIYNGKLYLNYSSVVWAIWSRNRNGYISRADARWPNVSKGLS